MKRIHSIDSFRFFAAFLVVTIHIPFPGKIGYIVGPLSRIAVPFFFMATGYFLWQKKVDLKKIQTQICKIFKMVILTNLFYLIWNIVLSFIDRKSIFEYIAGFFSLYNLKNTILFDASYFSGHLWYLSALLYLLIIYYFILKTNTLHYSRKIIILLLLIDLVLGKYSIVLLGREFPYQYVRNFLFVGLPYFLIGGILHENIERLERKKMSRLVIVLLCAFFGGTSVLGKYVLLRYHVSATREHYLSTTFLVFAIFVFLLQYKDWFKDSFFEKAGREYSLIIYIIHPIIIEILERIVVINNNLIEKLYINLAPIIVFVFSYFLAVVWTKMKKHTNIKEFI